MPTAELTDGRAVEYLPDPVADGSRRVHRTADGTGVVVFAGGEWDHDLFTRRVPLLLTRFNPTAGPGRAELFTWPTGAVARPAAGAVLPATPAHFVFAAGRFQGREKLARWLTSRKLWAFLSPDERGDWGGTVRAAAAAARAVAGLHDLGLTLASLAANDVLVDPARGAARLTRWDAVTLPGEPADHLGTPGAMAPEEVAAGVAPSESTNRHSLAVLVYELLLHRHPLRGPKVRCPESAEEDDRLSLGERALFIEHPADPSNRPADLAVPYSDLGPPLAGLVERAFVAGLHDPARRPTAAEWADALTYGPWHAHGW